YSVFFSWRRWLLRLCWELGGQRATSREPKLFPEKASSSLGVMLFKPRTKRVNTIFRTRPTVTLNAVYSCNKEAFDGPDCSRNRRSHNSIVRCVCMRHAAPRGIFSAGVVHRA